MTVDLEYYERIAKGQEHDPKILKAEMLELIDEIKNASPWISVKDRLPEEGIEPGICDKFLVTVQLKNPDPNDEPEAMILWFDTTLQQFTWQPGGKPYAENFSWGVTHWMPLPEPPKGEDNV